MQFFQNLNFCCCSGRNDKKFSDINIEYNENESSTDEKSQNVKQKKKKMKKRHPWYQKEDDQLLNFYEIYPSNWHQISKLMPGRSGKQIRDRYINALDPNINRDNWTQEEDLIYLLQGSKWSLIANFLKGRPENMIKNRFYSSLKKRLQKGDYNKQLIKSQNITIDLKDEQQDQSNLFNSQYMSFTQQYNREELFQQTQLKINLNNIMILNQQNSLQTNLQNNTQNYFEKIPENQHFQLEKRDSSDNKQQFYDNIEKKYNELINSNESINHNLQISLTNSENNLINQHVKLFEKEQNEQNIHQNENLNQYENQNVNQNIHQNTNQNPIIYQNCEKMQIEDEKQ